MRRRPSTLVFASALSGAWRVAACTLAGAATGVIVAWGLQQLAVHRDTPVLSSWPPAGAAAVLVALLAWRLLPRDTGRLSYDGVQWRLSAPTASSSRAVLHDGLPLVALDLGHWMLLRFEPGPGPAVAGGHERCRERADAPRHRWLPIAASTDPLAWPALRAALWTWRPGRDPSMHA